MFLFYVWNSCIALLNLFVIAIIILRREKNLTIILIIVQCLMRVKLSCHTYRCITMPKIIVISSKHLVQCLHQTIIYLVYSYQPVHMTIDNIYPPLSNGTVHNALLTNCSRGSRGNDRMIAGFATTYAISVLA